MELLYSLEYRRNYTAKPLATSHELVYYRNSGYFSYQANKHPDALLQVLPIGRISVH